MCLHHQPMRSRGDRGAAHIKNKVPAPGGMARVGNDGQIGLFLHHRNLIAAIRDNEPLHCPPELGLYGVAAIAGAIDSWFEKQMMTWDKASEQWV